MTIDKINNIVGLLLGFFAQHNFDLWPSASLKRKKLINSYKQVYIRLKLKPQQKLFCKKSQILLVLLASNLFLFLLPD